MQLHKQEAETIASSTAAVMFGSNIDIVSAAVHEDVHGHGDTWSVVVRVDQASPSQREVNLDVRAEPTAKSGVDVHVRLARAQPVEAPSQEGA
ncbi:hypothetical protein GCM10023199_43840 [Actinomycetospora chibensis]